jgi:hypothetical protein
MLITQQDAGPASKVVIASLYGKTEQSVIDPAPVHKKAQVVAVGAGYPGRAPIPVTVIEDFRNRK